MAEQQRRLYKLAGLDEYQLEHSDQDLRGSMLTTNDGRPVGRIDDMLVDVDNERVAALRLEDDRVIDIDHIDIRDQGPVLLVPHDRIPAAGRDFDRKNITSKHIPIIEERLEVAKRPIETGRLRVRTRVVETPVREQVEVRQEHVDVQRRPVDRAVTADEARSMLKDQDISVTEHGEKVVAAKEARVKEEIVIDKKTDVRRETVEGKVRHTEVDVDRDPTKRR